MRILFLSSGLSNKYGGAPLSESALATELAKRHDVTVLCPSDRFDSTFAQKNISCPVLPFSRKELFSAFANPQSQLRLLIRESSIFHINGHWRWENYLLARIATQYGVPYFLHPRGMLVLNERRRLLKRFFNLLLGNQIVRGASKVIALSHYETKHFLPYGIEEDKIFCLPNGIPDVDDKNLPEVDANPYFLYLGRLDPRKNLLFLLEVFSKLDGFLLYLVGPAEKSYDLALRDRIKELNLEKRVRTLAPVYGEEKWALLRGARAVIYPAVHEAFGRVLFETVKAGTFPIYPSESGGAEYLRRFLPFCEYQQGSVESLLEVIRLISSASEPHHAALAQAKFWTDKTLQWEGLSQRLEAIYHETLVSGSRGVQSLASIANPQEF